MDTNDSDEAIAAAVRRTASSVEPLAKSLAAAAGIASIPDTWYGIIAVAARAIWMDGNDYAHETPTQRIRVSNSRNVPVAADFVDHSNEPTVRTRRLR